MANLRSKEHRHIIGWKEKIDFPEWSIHGVVAKADTGARSSALDVKSWRHLGATKVEFEMVLDWDDPSAVRHLRAKLVRSTRVKSSNGVVQERVVIKTMVTIGKITKPVEFTLVSRQHMLCRVLLGRKAIFPEFVVDPGRKFLLSRQIPRID